MSEYWKSNAKFWCRFCKIYITDNKSTRNIHDSGAKHKENVERFLREQGQRGRDKEAETARLNKQMEAIEKAALKQYQLDVDAGLVKPSTSSPAPIKGAAGQATGAAPLPAAAATEDPSGSRPAVATPSPSSDSPSRPKADATGSNSEPVAAKADTVSRPATVRDEAVGQPGEWQTVEVPASRTAQQGQGDKDARKDESGNHYIPGADDEEDEIDPEDLRGFKIVEKTYPVEAELPGEDGEESGAVVFKKRKAGASRPRNIRRKL